MKSCANCEITMKLKAVFERLRNGVKVMKFGTHFRGCETFDLMSVFGLGVANWLESAHYNI